MTEKRVIDNMSDNNKDGDVESVKASLSDGAKVNWQNEEEARFSPLHLAAMKTENENLKIFKNLLAASPDLEKKNQFGETPLAIAAHFGHLKKVRCLLLSGAEINSEDFFGRTPLYRASLRGHEEVVKYLLMCGARKDMKNEDGFTAFGVAKNSRTRAAFDEFKMKGSFLHQALNQERKDIAFILIFKGSKGCNGENPFETLIRIVNDVEDLDQNIADMISSRGRTIKNVHPDKIRDILHLACKHGHEETVNNINKHLVENSSQYNENNLLHHGVLRKSLDIMKKAAEKCDKSAFLERN